MLRAQEGMSIVALVDQRPLNLVLKPSSIFFENSDKDVNDITLFTIVRKN